MQRSDVSKVRNVSGGWYRCIALAIAAVVGAAALVSSPAGAASGSRHAPHVYTVEDLRNMSMASLNRIMATADAGPMPAYGSIAKGYVRLDPDSPLDPLTQQLFLQLWQGKIWYTHASGGYLYNRMIADIAVHYHAVHYGISPVDGRRAIIVEPGFPVDQFYDEIRMVEPGLYLGYSMLRNSYGIALPRNQRMLVFILDFNHSQLTAQECALCQLGLSRTKLKIVWPLGPKNPLGLAPRVG